MSKTIIPVSAPGCGKDYKVTTKQALQDDTVILYIFCQARVVAMFGINHTTGDTKAESNQTVQLKALAQQIFARSLICFDEVQTLLLWSFWAPRLLLSCIVDNIPLSVKLCMTATALFNDKSRDSYMTNQLQLKEGYYLKLESCVRSDIQAITINLDVLLKKGVSKSDVSAFMMQKVHELHHFVKYGLKGIVLVLLPTPSRCEEFRKDYATAFDLEMKLIPLILGCKDQSKTQKAEVNKLLAEKRSSLIIGSPAAAQGITLSGVYMTIQMDNCWGAHHFIQGLGRAHRSNQYDPAVPIGYCVVFQTCRDVWSEYISAPTEQSTEAHQNSRQMMRDILSSAKQVLSSRRHCIISTDTYHHRSTCTRLRVVCSLSEWG